MKKIIFRGRDIQDIWRHGSLIIDEVPIIGTQYIIVQDRVQYVLPDNSTIGQFTGLTDKNGKEIYEGDILYDKFEDNNEEKGFCEVYNEVVFQFGAYGFIGEVTGEFLPFSTYPIGKEIVISNIHDNPELLDQ